MNEKKDPSAFLLLVRHNVMVWKTRRQRHVISPAMGKRLLKLCWSIRDLSGPRSRTKRVETLMRTMFFDRYTLNWAWLLFVWKLRKTQSEDDIENLFEDHPYFLK